MLHEHDPHAGCPTWKAFCWPAPQQQGKQLIGALSPTCRSARQLAFGGHSVRWQSRARAHSSIPYPGSCNSRQHGEPARNGVSVETKDFPSEWRKHPLVDGFTLDWTIPKSINHPSAQCMLWAQCMLSSTRICINKSIMLENWPTPLVASTFRLLTAHSVLQALCLLQNRND